eukprot:707453-Rhodomonas_salina.1
MTFSPAQSMHSFLTVPNDLVNEGENDWSCCSQGDLGCLDADADMKIPTGSSTCLSDDIVDLYQLVECNIETDEFPFLATSDNCSLDPAHDPTWFVSLSGLGGKNTIIEDGHADNSSEGDEWGFPFEEEHFDACSSLSPAYPHSAASHNKEGVNKSQVATRRPNSAHDLADPSWRDFLSTFTPASLNAKTSDESEHADDSTEGEGDFNSELQSQSEEDQQERQTKRRKGGTRSKNHNKHDVAILLKWYMMNLHNPFPREEVKVELSKITSMTPSQVSTWFVNQRKRSPYRKLVSKPYHFAKNPSSIRIPSARHFPA